MKKFFLYGAWKLLNRSSDPYRRRKHKKLLALFAAFAFFSVVMLGGFAVWGTISLMNHAAAGIQTIQVDKLVNSGKEQIETFTSKPLVSQSCVDTLIGLTFSPTRWLTIPLAQNLQLVTSNCSLQHLWPIQEQQTRHSGNDQA